MSGLLNRLASQAFGAAVSNEPRIRPAASVHARVPFQQPEPDSRQPSLRTLPELPAENPARDPGVRTETKPAPARFDAAATVDQAARRQPGAFAPLVGFRPTPQFVEKASVATPAQRAPQVGEFESRTPRALLAEVPVGPVPPPTIAPLTPARLQIEPTRSRAAGEPTEVHVHIGRIEVTAMPEPAAAAKKPRPPARSTRPLSEYLARPRSP